MIDLARPRRALCIILGLSVTSFFIIEMWGQNTGRPAADESFTVTQRFYGVDAAEMERIAAGPLEDALSGIRGLKRIFSSSENGRVRVMCYFEGREQGRYEAVREAAQQVYESLPSAAQRPEISVSGDSRVPVWTAAFTSGLETGTVLEKAVKPALEALPGAGDVEVSGAGLREILITLKSEQASARRLETADLAALLGQNDTLLPGGTVRFANGREIPVMVDGRYAGTEALKYAVVPLETEGGFVRLEDIAEVTEQERDYENRSRLNGKTAALIAVLGSDGADLGKLSAAIKEELAKFPALEYTVLSDRGEAEKKARTSALAAALQGAFAVALLTVLICSRNSTGRRNFSPALICALTVPVVIFFSAALLTLFGFSLDKLVLAGLSAGVGAAVDAAILCAEYFRSCNNKAEGKSAIERLRFPLMSGALTTIIALLPLMVQPASGMNAVAWAVASVNLIAMALALTLLPPLFFWGRPLKNKSALKRARINAKFPAVRRIRFTPKVLALIGERFTPKVLALIGERFTALPLSRTARFFRRSLAGLLRFLFHRPLLTLGCWALLGILGIGALYLSGADVEQDYAEDSVYAQIEFDGGLHIEETDKILAVYGDELKNHPGILNVQTVARTGTGSAMVSFDPHIIEGSVVRELMRTAPAADGFVYIVESSRNERNWRLLVSGDETERCRELAAEAARICAAVPGILETVLNFKEGSPRLDLKPDRERLARAGISSGSIGQSVRRNIHGPVAYKRIALNGGSNSSEIPGGEIDVRIRGRGEVLSTEEVLGIIIKGQKPLLLGQAVYAENGREAASIQREDRRRAASITCRTAVSDPRRIRDKVMPALEKLDLPPGYRIEFDPEAIKAAEGVSGQGGLFILALLFCYLLIAAFKESFTFPLAVLAVVPPSLALPALCLILRGYPLNAVSAAAFVAVSGIAVNAAVLIADALQHERPNAASWYLVFRKKLPVLAAVTGTTVAGAVPFLFIKSGAALVIKTLSLVSALGVAVSALCALTLIPALIKLFPGILLSFGEIAEGKQKSAKST
ncbi:hypothetical protein AGMMS50230_07750 [Spirochaetia bacterium]|nr:hypothetical protein AGMMS50230_07750 [Spirochaetia bacterium]